MRIRPFVLLVLVVPFLFVVVGGCSRDTAPRTDVASDRPVDPAATADTADSNTQSGATLPAEGTTPEIAAVAVVNAVPITEDSLERARQQVLSRYQQIYSQFGQDVRTLLVRARGRLFELQIEDEALELAATRALTVGELNRRGASVSEDEVEAEFLLQYAKFLDSFGLSEEEFKAAFETGALAGFQIGELTFDQFINYARLAVREEFEIQAVQRLIAGTIVHTDAELVAFFEEYRSDYETAEQVRASHILVATEELAQQLLDELASGADFAALAQEHSIDTGSNARGGDLGWFGRGRMVIPFEEAAFNIPVGELPGIIQTQYGYHIIWVTDHLPEVKPEYEDVADLVASDYDAEIMAQRFNEWYTVTRPTADISVIDPMLNAYRKQEEDLDQGLQAFLEIRDEGTVDDPYLSYIIATIYETRMDAARSEKLGIEGNDPITPSQRQQIDALEAEIATDRSLALDSYRSALTQLGDDAEITARIEALSPAENAPALPN